MRKHDVKRLNDLANSWEEFVSGSNDIVFDQGFETGLLRAADDLRTFVEVLYGNKNVT